MSMNETNQAIRMQDPDNNFYYYQEPNFYVLDYNTNDNIIFNFEEELYLSNNATIQIYLLKDLKLGTTTISLGHNGTITFDKLYKESTLLTYRYILNASSSDIRGTFCLIAATYLGNPAIAGKIYASYNDLENIPFSTVSTVDDMKNLTDPNNKEGAICVVLSSITA